MDNISPEELIRRTHMGIARLRESQRQLVQDIQERYNELGMAVDQLRSYFNSDSGEDQNSPADDKNCRESKRKRRQSCALHLNDIARPLSSDVVSFLQDRQYGFRGRSRYSQSRSQFLRKQLPDFVSQHLPAILSEKELVLGTMNKVFASKWLNDSQVVLGTKCNKLMVMDVRNNDLVHIPSLRSSEDSVPADCPCGIHAIAINPSRTLLATGAQNTNDLAVYELPTFDALCVGEDAHKDWIFDMDWVDDEHIVTGSRDSTVALWRVNNQSPSLVGASRSVGHSVIKPCQVKPCNRALRVRALALSRNTRLMGVLSMDAKFHFWDLGRFQQLETLDLPWRRENVCVASSDELGVFAVGSEAYVTLVDHRLKPSAKCRSLQIPPRFRERGAERGIRSLSFNENIITIGTGDGRLLFFDMKNNKFLLQMDGKHCELQVGEGWLRNDSNYRDHFLHGYYPNAIYTHCYDEARARIFAAGGPLPAGLYGNYAGLFY
ncbi:DDB1- and CUL4-associated factor 12 [Aplysia californica]|uniref:DDB1- and CUL4-associated factor 12 n=1 Tax=Aplysia californica TaxID=6500 RepID=A0ABM0JHV0_APLCA|nr:DDB1- and CUL4-associated factor 12 [Aplysia californica]